MHRKSKLKAAPSPLNIDNSSTGEPSTRATRLSSLPNPNAVLHARNEPSASSPSNNREAPSTPTRRYQTLRDGFRKIIVDPLRSVRRSFSVQEGAENADDAVRLCPSSSGSPSTAKADLASADDVFLPASYTRSTSTKASPIAQQSLDSSNADERSSKRLIIFKESALASGVKLMQAANLENKELLFYHLLKVNNAFNILPNSSKVVVFDVRLPVKKAFYALVYNSVRAATLVDSEQRFVGMLTITDFIQILHHYEAQGKDYIKELEHNRICDWKTVQAEQKLAHPFLFIYAEQSLFTAVDILIRNAIHRLPIIDSKTHNILYILTLKRLLKYLYLYSLDLRPAFLSKTPKELDVGTFDNVVTVTHRTPLREAMRKFMDHRVSSLPVVDQDLIVQDIYCKFDVINLLANNSYENLNISVREALQQRWVSRQRDDMRLRTNFFEDVIKCSPTDCLWKVIETLVFHQIHRVMIVDEEQHLCGLVSLSDIFKFFIIPRVEVSNVIPSWTSDMIDADMADNAPPTVGPFRSRSRDDE